MTLSNESFAEVCGIAVGRFKRVTRAYALFHLVFLSIAVCELLFFFFFFTLFSKSFFLALFLAALFLTSFTYFVLLFYLQAKKPEQLQKIRHWYLAFYHERHQQVIAAAALHFAKALENQEYRYYFLPFFLKPLEPGIQKLSCIWHWKDVLKMRELLLFASIREYIDLIKLHPNDLETHASLGMAYVQLAHLYLDFKKSDEELEKWIPPEFASDAAKAKFKAGMERAIEEFKILQHFLPDDLWVHAQLATVYHSLKMTDREIGEYEIIQRLSPDDFDILLRLGILYFEQGQNVKGLKVYQQLKEREDARAEELISHYDAYTHPVFEDDL